MKILLALMFLMNSSLLWAQTPDSEKRNTAGWGVRGTDNVSVTEEYFNGLHLTKDIEYVTIDMGEPLEARKKILPTTLAIVVIDRAGHTYYWLRGKNVEQETPVKEPPALPSISNPRIAYQLATVVDDSLDAGTSDEDAVDKLNKLLFERFFKSYSLNPPYALYSDGRKKSILGFVINPKTKKMVQNSCVVLKDRALNKEVEVGSDDGNLNLLLMCMVLYYKPENADIARDRVLSCFVGHAGGKNYTDVRYKNKTIFEKKNYLKIEGLINSIPGVMAQKSNYVPFTAQQGDEITAAFEKKDY